MPHRSWTNKTQRAVFVTCMVAFALFVSLTSCRKPDEPKPAQRTFASPAEAGAALLEAAKTGDQSAFLAIFGPDGKELLFSGDAVKDKNVLQDFVAAYSQVNRWREIKVG